MRKILIIEDDLAIAEIERDFLMIAGYEADITGDGIDGINKASQYCYDLILLDLMLPGLDGFEVCKHIRDKTDSPILMVSARGEEHDKIRGLGLGADDYITKPFSPSELVARVNANLAQYDRLKPLSERPAQPIQLGALQINQLSRRVLVSGREVDLKNKEYELLVMLASNPDTVFSKEQIYEAIWGQDAFGDLKTVAVHINRLREKIESDPQNPQFIQTVWGAGYRLKI